MTTGKLKDGGESVLRIYWTSRSSVREKEVTASHRCVGSEALQKQWKMQEVRARKEVRARILIEHPSASHVAASCT